MPDPRIERWRAVNRHEMDARVAEYRLATEGIKPELLAYVVGIGEAARGSGDESRAKH